VVVLPHCLLVLLPRRVEALRTYLRVLLPLDLLLESTWVWAVVLLVLLPDRLLDLPYKVEP
jgi:hypothetical protein